MCRLPACNNKTHIKDSITALFLPQLIALPRAKIFLSSKINSNLEYFTTYGLFEIFLSPKKNSNLVFLLHTAPRVSEYLNAPFEIFLSAKINSNLEYFTTYGLFHNFSKSPKQFKLSFLSSCTFFLDFDGKNSMEKIPFARLTSPYRYSFTRDLEKFPNSSPLLGLRKISPLSARLSEFLTWNLEKFSNLDSSSPKLAWT